MSEALKEARRKLILEIANKHGFIRGELGWMTTEKELIAALEELEAALSRSAGPDEDTQMLYRIRASLKARSEGRNEGGDIEVMKHVDAIVARENSRSAICGNSCVLKSNHEGPCKHWDEPMLAESPSESAPVTPEVIGTANQENTSQVPEARRFDSCSGSKVESARGVH